LLVGLIFGGLTFKIHFHITNSTRSLNLRQTSSSEAKNQTYQSRVDERKPSSSTKPFLYGCISFPLLYILVFWLANGLLFSVLIAASLAVIFDTRAAYIIGAIFWLSSWIAIEILVAWGGVVIDAFYPVWVFIVSSRLIL